MKPMITELIRTRRVYFDGGFGSLLLSRGLKPGQPPESWNLSHPEEVTGAHREYFAAGCDIIKTNTFGVNSLKYPDYKDILRAGLRCAKKAAGEFPGRYIALDIGPLGRLLQPLGDLSFEEAVTVFTETFRAVSEMKNEGLLPDLILIETMNDAYETKAAVLAAKETLALPVFVTNVYDENGKLMTGADPAAMIALLEGLRVDAIGMNCSLGPDKMLPFMQQFRDLSSLPLIVNPNAGLPEIKDGKTIYSMTDKTFADYAEALAENGASILGGCCGTTPDTLREVIRKTKNLPLPEITKKHITAVSSYTHAVTVGTSPVLIGERINPTGKPKFKEALRAGDIQYIRNEGIRQADRGAHILDVNVGLPEIDEPQMMVRAVKALQEITDLPLQIDTSSPEALEQALRIYNGKPLVNSVNGKEESMESVFPLVKKYGGTVIALTLDETGIPDTAEKRLQIAENIMTKARDYGIEENDIIVDPLALTISSDPKSAEVTLKTIRALTERGIRTSLGVSNISFGLPKRDLVNSTFFAAALENGLSCAIMNPFSAAMTDVYHAFCALKGFDPACAAYIEYAQNRQETETAAVPPAQTAARTTAEEGTLQHAILKGLSESAERITETLLQTTPPLEVINQQIIPALNAVGADFEAGRAYLPQLLMSADAASAAFARVKEKLPPANKDEGRGMILATVKGDIHDIGKNIVAVLMESFGFTVYDLGRDVPPETVLEAVKDTNCRLVGLSALMTTTVPAMEETIRLLREYDPEIRTVVGGAVLTQEYADSIHADFYAKDAMETVRYAEKYYQRP